MKRILALLLAITILAQPAMSYAGQAVMLSDDELDGISAAGFEIDLAAASLLQAALGGAGLTNAVSSASVTQGNMGAMYASDGDINSASIVNSNSCSANGTGSASVVNQHNLGVMVSAAGSIIDSAITNTNTAVAAGNPVSVTQGNIAMMIAAGNIENCAITNTNSAQVSSAQTASLYTFNNLPGANQIQLSYTADLAAAQSNIGILVSLNGDIVQSQVTNINSVQAGE